MLFFTSKGDTCKLANLPAAPFPAFQRLNFTTSSRPKDRPAEPQMRLAAVSLATCLIQPGQSKINHGVGAENVASRSQPALTRLLETTENLKNYAFITDNSSNVRLSKSLTSTTSWSSIKKLRYLKNTDTTSTVDSVI